MGKRHKKQTLIRHLLQKEYDMTTQKKNLTHEVRVKRCKAWTTAHLAGTKGHSRQGTRRKIGRTIQLAPKQKLSHEASFGRAVERSIAATKKKGNPIAKYDALLRQAYLEYPDGKKVYVE